MDGSLIEVEKSLRLFYADNGVTITSREYLVQWVKLVSYRFFFKVVGKPCGERFQPNIQDRFRNELSEEARTVGLNAPTLPNFDAQNVAHLIFIQSLMSAEFTDYGTAMLFQLPDAKLEEMPPPQLEDYSEALFK